MGFWYVWEEISRVMAVLFLVTALASAAAAGLLLVYGKLTDRIRQYLRSEKGRRMAVLAVAAAGIWILLIGKSASAAEAAGATGAAPAETAPEETAADESAAHETAPKETAADESASHETAQKETASAEASPAETAPELAAAGNTDGSASGETAAEQEPETEPDEQPPDAVIRMTGAPNKDSGGIYYCRSDNAGICVTFEDSRETDTGIVYCSVTVTDSAGEKIEREWRSGQTEHEETDLETWEIAALADGPVEVTAETADAAGNSTKTGLYFVLDTTRPLLTEILTYSGSAPAGVRTVFDGTDLYYNDAELTTRIRIEDSSPVSWRISCFRQSGLDSTGRGERLAMDRRGDGPEGSMTISEEGVYADWAVEGEDLAGNRLLPAKNCRYSQDAEALQEESGAITYPRRKILDRTAPVGEISYTSGKTGYVYGTEVYYGADVEAALEISDRCAGAEMPMDEKCCGFLCRRGDSVERAAQGKFVLKEDGRVQLGAFGCDRAGNGLIVREKFKSKITVMEERDPAAESSEPEPDDRPAPQPAGEGGAFCSVIVRDTVCPSVTAQTSLPAQDPAAIDEENGIVYYSARKEQYGGQAPVISVLFTIEDQNIDEAGIQTCSAYAAVPEGMNCEQVHPAWTDAVPQAREAAELPRGDPGREAAKLPGGDPGREQITLSESTKAEETGECRRLQLRIRRYPGGSDTPDGVYRFGVSGTDKAGNPLMSPEAEDRTYGLICENAEEGAFMTGRKAVDTMAPSGEIRIENESGDVYCRLAARSRGWTMDSSGLMPYRRENAAHILCLGEDRSPVSFTCRILSTSGDRNDPPPDGSKYRGEAVWEFRIRRPQVFRLERALLRDRAGNETEVLTRTVNVYLDTGLPSVDLDAPAAAVRAIPEISARTADGRPLYAGRVRLEVTAEDTDRKHGASGLREVRYAVLISGSTVREETLLLSSGSAPQEETARFSAGEAAGGQFPVDRCSGQAPVYRYSGEIEIPSGGRWESNDIEVRVTAEDNAGNRSDPEEGVLRLGIDTEGPGVTVRYDNNEVKNGQYFDRARKAEITVRERCFDRSALRVLAPGASVGDWRRSASGNADEWTREVLFAADGSYTLEVAGADALGNPAEVQYLGAAPQAFTVDGTPPLVEVLWDNTDVRSGRYYNRARRAVVRITELSFDERKVRLSPLSRGFRRTSEVSGALAPQAVPVFEAELPFTEEGEWFLRCACTDLAGNAAVPVAEGPFVIDMTPPRVYFDPASVREMGAYGGLAEPLLRCEDENMAAGTCWAMCSNLTAGGRMTACRGGASGKILLPDPPRERSADGICVLSGTACDLAGNRSYCRRNMCVNRFGSLYDITEDAATAEMLGSFYTDGKVPLVVAEYNVSPLTGRQITLYRNGAGRVLEEGTDFTVAEEKSPAGVKYVYRIDPAVYGKEGKYSLLLESEDAAGGFSSSPGRFGSGADFSPEWAVDRTPPSVRLTGNTPGRDRYIADKIPLRVIPADNMELRELIIRITDDRGDPILERTIRKKELEEILGENMGEVPVEVGACPRWQILEAEAVDGAGNRSSGLTDTGGRRAESCRLLVSSNLLVHLYRSGVLAAAAFLALTAAILCVYSVYKHTLA